MLNMTQKLELELVMRLNGLKSQVQKYGKNLTLKKHIAPSWPNVIRDIDNNYLIMLSTKDEIHVYLGVGYNNKTKTIYCYTNWKEPKIENIPINEVNYMCGIDIN